MWKVVSDWFSKRFRFRKGDRGVRFAPTDPPAFRATGTGGGANLIRLLSPDGCRRQSASRRNLAERRVGADGGVNDR